MTFTHCKCPAYDFPHRPIGGKCTGEHLRNEIFLDGLACHARDCSYLAQTTETEHLSGRPTIDKHEERCCACAADCPEIEKIIKGLRAPKPKPKRNPQNA